MGDEIRLFLQSCTHCQILLNIKRFRIWKRFSNG